MIREELAELVHKFEVQRDKQDLYNFRYQTAHYLLGYPQIICSALLTYFTGVVHVNWATAVGLLGTLLSVSIVFFRLQDQASAFRSVKLQYEDLIADIDIGLHEQSADLEELYRAIKEKEKYITSYKRKPASCCSSQGGLCSARGRGNGAASLG